MRSLENTDLSLSSIAVISLLDDLVTSPPSVLLLDLKSEVLGMYAL